VLYDADFGTQNKDLDFVCVEANDVESEERIMILLAHFQFTLVKKIKVNLLFINTNSYFDSFLKSKSR
jgi:hypothetical protein